MTYMHPSASSNPSIFNCQRLLSSRLCCGLVCLPRLRYDIIQDEVPEERDTPAIPGSSGKHRRNKVELSKVPQRHWSANLSLEFDDDCDGRKQGPRSIDMHQLKLSRGLVPLFEVSKDSPQLATKHHNDHSTYSHAQKPQKSRIESQQVDGRWKCT